MNKTLLAAQRCTRSLAPALLLAISFSSALLSQSPQLVGINPLYFTMPVGGPNPQAQTFSVTSASAGLSFSHTVQTAAGGNWLQVSTGSGCSLFGTCTTPAVLSVSVNAATLPAGVYTGTIMFSSGTTPTTASVTLTVEDTAGAFFGQLIGQLGFVFGGGTASAPLPQTVEISNAGSGQLKWDVAVSTSAGGNWLTVSARSGVAPSMITVSVSTQGLNPGIYTGQLLFQAATGSVTVPVNLVVAGSSINEFNQVPSLSFTMPAGGANPQAQTFTVTSTSSGLSFGHTVETFSGGNWLQVSTGAGCSLFGTCTTPAVLSVSVNANTLPAGVYTGAIVFGNGMTMTTVPVTLTVAGTTAAFFGEFIGQLGFVFGGGTASAPLPQTIEISNAGSGQLHWTVAVSTSGGGNWLIVSAQKGVAPSMVTVSVSAQGLNPGIYTGQLLFQAATGSVTVPVSLEVTASGTNEFNQVPSLSFTMPEGGPNPQAQTLTVTSTSAGLSFDHTVQTVAGGNWLQVSTGSGCTLFGTCTTPAVLSISVDATTLPGGTYTGTIVLTTGTAELTVSVTLTIGPSINAGGVVNDASYAGGASMAAGSIAAVFGNFLISSVSQFTTLPLPTSLAGVSLEFSGGTPAPLYFVSGGQVNIQVPWELAGQSQASLTAFVNGLPSPAQVVSLAPFDPGIFTTNAQGTGQGAILDNSTNLLVDSSNPATAGITYIQIYCTGLGAVTNQPADGAMALSDPLSWTTTTPTVTIGGIPATVVFYGLAPGFVGLYQINALVPATAPAGNAVPVAISMGEVTSNTVTIAVQ